MKQINSTSRHNKKNPDMVRNIFLDILFALVTCGLYNVYVQYCQILAINDMLNEKRYSFLKWLIFSIFTFGLYHIYHEYVKGEDIDKCTGIASGNTGVICLILTICGLSIIADAIQQSHINRFYGENLP